MRRSDINKISEGTRVKIKNNLELGVSYDDYSYVSGMVKGEWVTVDYVYDNWFKIRENPDNSRYYYTMLMVERIKFTYGK